MFRIVTKNHDPSTSSNQTTTFAWIGHLMSVLLFKTGHELFLLIRLLPTFLLTVLLNRVKKKETASLETLYKSSSLPFIQFLDGNQFFWVSNQEIWEPDLYRFFLFLLNAKLTCSVDASKVTKLLNTKSICFCMQFFWHLIVS